MTGSEQRRAAVEAARAAFRPARFGLLPRGHGWVRPFPGLGEVAFVPLAWPHAQCASFVRDGQGEPVATDALSLVVRLQAETWGMPPEEVVPVNVLAVLAETGGSLLVAYQLEAGFNGDGWLGFAIALGGRDGALVSHMLGVRPDARGGHGIGWHLKVLQGHLALETGHRAASWTFDPMRGANARLNLEKLGSTVERFTLDKYGALRSALYGNVPSDRFTAHWDLLNPRTACRLDAVARGEHRGMPVECLTGWPEATPANVDALVAERPPCLWYRIPADVDALMRDDPASAIRWRGAMRSVLSRLLPTAAATGPDGGSDPLAVGHEVAAGAYRITGFVSGEDATGRLNAYLLERRDGDGEGAA